MSKISKEPEYKQLNRQLERLQKDLVRVEAEWAEIQAKIDEALLAEEDAGALQRQAATIDQTRRNLSRRLELIRRRLNELEPVQLRDEIAEIDRTMEQQANELRKARDKWDQLRAEFWEKEGHYKDLFISLTRSIERLRDKRAELEGRLLELEGKGEEEPEEKPPVSKSAVANWLKKLRDGEVSSIVTGQDPNLDEACQRYEEEKEEIRHYARMLRAGVDPTPPACKQYYSPDRFNELMRG